MSKIHPATWMLPAFLASAAPDYRRRLSAPIPPSSLSSADGASNPFAVTPVATPYPVSAIVSPNGYSPPPLVTQVAGWPNLIAEAARLSTEPARTMVPDLEAFGEHVDYRALEGKKVLDAYFYLPAIATLGQPPFAITDREGILPKELQQDFSAFGVPEDRATPGDSIVLATGIPISTECRALDEFLDSVRTGGPATRLGLGDGNVRALELRVVQLRTLMNAVSAVVEDKVSSPLVTKVVETVRGNLSFNAFFKALEWWMTGGGSGV